MILHCIFRPFNVVLKFCYLYLNVIVHKILDVLIFKIPGPLSRPALELYGLPCVNIFLLYFNKPLEGIKKKRQKNY